MKPPLMKMRYIIQWLGSTKGTTDHFGVRVKITENEIEGDNLMIMRTLSIDMTIGDTWSTTITSSLYGMMWHVGSM